MSRDVLEQILGWGVIVAIVAAVVLGKRRANAANAAAVATAIASARQDWEAELAAVASASVNVAVDASDRRVGSIGRLAPGDADPVDRDRMLRIIQSYRLGELEHDRAATNDRFADHAAGHATGFHYGTGLRGVPVESLRPRGVRSGDHDGDSAAHALDCAASSMSVGDDGGED